MFDNGSTKIAGLFLSCSRSDRLGDDNALNPFIVKGKNYCLVLLFDILLTALNKTTSNLLTAQKLHP